MCVCVFPIHISKPFSVVNIVLVLIYFGEWSKIYGVQCSQLIKKYLLLRKDHTVSTPTSDWRTELPSRCTDLFSSSYKYIFYFSITYMSSYKVQI